MGIVVVEDPPFDANSLIINIVLFCRTGSLLKHIQPHCVATVGLFVLAASAAECKPCSLPSDVGITCLNDLAMMIKRHEENLRPRSTRKLDEMLGRGCWGAV